MLKKYHGDSQERTVTEKVRFATLADADLTGRLGEDEQASRAAGARGSFYRAQPVGVLGQRALGRSVSPGQGTSSNWLMANQTGRPANVARWDYDGEMLDVPQTRGNTSCLRDR